MYLGNTPKYYIMRIVFFLLACILCSCDSTNPIEGWSEVNNNGIDGYLAEADIHYQMTFESRYLIDSYLKSRYANLTLRIHTNKWGEERLAIVIDKPSSSGNYTFDLRQLIEDYVDDHNISQGYSTMERFAIWSIDGESPKILDSKGYKGLTASNSVMSLVHNQTKNGCIDWYYVITQNGTVVSEDYVGTTCPCGRDELKTQCGGSGGGVGGVNPEETPPDCESFPFYKDMDETLHITGVHQVRFHCNYFGWGEGSDRNSGTFVFSHHEYTFNQILYFNAPFYLTSGEAANATSDAIDRVNERLEEIYGAHGFPRPNVLEANIIRLLNEEMKKFGGSAGFKDNGVPTSHIGIFNEKLWPSSCN
jgi:hypothetical protein